MEVLLPINTHVIESESLALRPESLDNKTIGFIDGWGLVRASNTQPVIVCRFEAKTLDRMEEIQNKLDKLKPENGKSNN